MFVSINCIAQHRGWSRQGKDAAIGGGAGAILGAVIDKNHAAGAVIGGALGAGGGYLYGKHKNKELREQQELAAARRYRNEHSGTYNSNRQNNYLSSTTANSAYGSGSMQPGYLSYYHNAAYGYQMKSW